MVSDEEPQQQLPRWSHTQDPMSLPGRNRSARFTPEETMMLVAMVKQRQEKIYGTTQNIPKPSEVKRAWEEVASTISATFDITRTPMQCRKRYNDIRRRGKQKAAALRKQRKGTGYIPIDLDCLTPVNNVAASTLCPGNKAPLVAPEAESSTQEQRPVVAEARQTPARLTHTRPFAAKHIDFLQHQQRRGFQMLERQLRALQHTTVRLFQPLNRIAAAVERIAERAAPPPITSSTLPAAVSAPTSPSQSSPPPVSCDTSRTKSRRGTPGRRTRGRQKL